jgi:flagellar basal body rod protein FlgG
MIYGLYLSAQGAEARSTQLDVISNNLANAQTSSFKRDLALFQARQPHDLRFGTDNEPPGNLDDHTGGVELSGIVTDHSAGPLNPTGGTYDVAIAGSGFLQVSDGEQNFLTRNGSLTVNADGELVTSDQGLQVLTESGGTIAIPEEARDVQILANGDVDAINDVGTRVQLGRLALVEPESYDSLTKLGNSLYVTPDEVVAKREHDQIRQGYLEGSGTQSVSEMVQLIGASRAFETNINMIRFQDESLSQLLQVIPRR